MRTLQHQIAVRRDPDLERAVAGVLTDLRYAASDALTVLEDAIARRGGRGVDTSRACRVTQQLQDLLAELGEQRPDLEAAS